jgi:iron complex outermembrane receptor protein
MRGLQPHLRSMPHQLRNFKTSIGVTPITSLDLGYQLTKSFKLSAGAVKLFKRYPPQISSTLLGRERGALDNSAVQIYPLFSPWGIDGGYCYARAAFSF